MNKATCPEQADHQSHKIDTAVLAAVESCLPKLQQLTELFCHADNAEGDNEAFGLFLSFLLAHDQALTLQYKAHRTPNADTIGALISHRSSLSEQGHALLEMLQCGHLVLLHPESGNGL